MSLRTYIGQKLRAALGISGLECEIQRSLAFSQALEQFVVPEHIQPDQAVFAYSAAQIEKAYGIAGFDPVIHKNDLMFQHHLRKMPDKTGTALFHYYNVGLDALSKIKKLVPEAENILEFGAGYGRVSRFLPHFYKDAVVHVSDVKEGAMRFQAEQFGFKEIIHTEDPASFKSSQQYDLIVAISVFSHLPEDASSEWLKRMVQFLAAGGKIIFTYNPLESKGEAYRFIEQSEDAGLSWVPDRIRKSEVYGSAFYTRRHLESLLDDLGIDYQVIGHFSGSQNAVFCKVKTK